MPDALATLWERTDLQSPAIDGDEALRLNDGDIARLISAGLIRETQAATSVTCDACDLGHVEDVVFIDMPADAGVRAYIMCPDNGRVRVPIERLRRWELDFDGMARGVARAIASEGAPEEIVAARVWFVGKAVFANRSRDVFLARGLTWLDSHDILAQASRLTMSGAPLVFVAGAMPQPAVWGTNVPPVLPLSAVLSLNGNRLEIDKMHVEGAVSGRADIAVKLSPEDRKRRIKDKQALFTDVSISFATEPGARHIVRINGFDFGGFRSSDLKFTRLLLLAAARAADVDADGGGWLDKWRLLGDEGDHDLQDLRAELEKHGHPDLDAQELKALIKPSGKRDGRIRLAVHPYQVTFDDSLARFQFVGERQTQPKKRERRPTRGSAKHEADMKQARTTAAKLLSEARKLGVPGSSTRPGRGE